MIIMRNKNILDCLKETRIYFVVMFCCLLFVSGIGSVAFADSECSSGHDGAKATSIGEAQIVVPDGTGKVIAAGGNDSGSFSPEAPLSHKQLERMQHEVCDTFRKHLVGRKFIKIYGPLGAGAQSVPWDTYLPPAMGNLDLLGESEQQPVGTQKRAFLPVPQIYKDFILYNRDIAATGHEHSNKADDGCICMPLDLSTLINAVTQCAKKEDDMIFNGLPEMGIPGLTNVEGRNIIPMKDWSVVGDGFLNVVEAAQTLAETGFYGPYALVVSPPLYIQLHRVLEKTGVLEIQRVKSFIKCGVYSSQALKGNKAVVVATGRNNMDLVTGKDMGLDYWGPENLNHRFRVWESAVLRIKCAQAICTIE